MLHKTIKVKDIINILSEYNPEADLCVVVDYYPTEFEICYGGCEGCTKASCSDVSLMTYTNAALLPVEETEKT